MANRDIIVKLRLAGEEFDRDFKVKFQDLEAAAEKSSIDAGARSGGGFMKGFLGAAGLGALGAAIGTAISSAADLGAEIASTSRQFNIGAEQLQVWRQAASNAGVSANDFNSSLASLTQKIGEANAGNRAAQQSFVDLGIGFATTAGQARATDAVMLDLATRIAAIEDPAKRVQLGVQLLGDDFKNLYPLLLNGADGFNAAAAEVDRFGGALSAKEIQDLQQINANITNLKDQLSRSVAKVVAENADAINALADSLFGLAEGAVKASGDLLTFMRTEAQYRQQVSSLPKGLSPEQRAAAVGNLNRRFGRREVVTGSYFGGLITTKDVRFVPSVNSDWAGPGGFLSRYPGVQEAAAPPRVTGGGGRRTGGGGRRTGGGRTARETPEERLAKQAARDAIRNEQQFRDALARTLKVQEDSATVQRIRTEQGEVAAARAEAELGFLRQMPLAVNETVEALAKALGFDGQITEERRAQLQLYLDQVKAIKDAAGDAAEAKARAEIERDTDRQNDRNQEIADQAAARWKAAHEQAILDVADIYETAMRGGVDDLWGYFKDEGTRIIAEIAAQWTLAMIAGQPFNLNSALGGAFGRSPLASIFLGSGAFGAANDNGFAVSGFGGGVFRLGSNPARYTAGGLLPSGAADGFIPNGAGGGFDATLRGGAGFLQSPAFALGLGSVATSIFGNGSTGSQIGGMIGSIGGQELGSSIGALGSFGGPIGAIAGAILGSVLPGLLSGTKRGSATVGGVGGTLGITGTRGNSRSREATARSSAGSLIDAIFQIADQLGGTVDASRGRVSIGVRDDNFRVDPTGQGRTKTRRGAVDFGSDQEAAIRFAVQDLIRDGVITGISQASQNLLQRGGDLEAQIEKALLIEQIPKLLRQRLDPLGAALDELFDKFKAVNDALVEGSASAEQFAQARQLWELEKADAIASIGAASQSLKDFLASLNAGSSSPLSLREQRAEAERQLEPFLAQISAAEQARAEVERLRAGGASAAEIEAAEAAARTAAAAINQDGFTQASQLLLSISRQSNASSGAFFSDFDRIRALTGSAIGFIDQAAARDADTRDPFSSAIAQNTQDAAIILSEQSVILNQILTAINDNGFGVGGGGFTREARSFAV
ncbi:hypothetical protein [Rhizorhabdus sp.]|uniref:hypothetical protein n=1 Tax=Rhizorhabdus sp. TaxID=1968843 RepID=UPI00199E7A9A|nr:hypothetical protein [Rhizorhabdus sp.]MBD3762439.1 hypothetical protein [Rhizorhabdus sp.]